MLVRSKDPVYPLKASYNNRYLVDQNNTPFLMVGDSPQQLITNLSQKEAAAYIANRQSYGVNTLWINLLCIFSDGMWHRLAVGSTAPSRSQALRVPATLMLLRTRGELPA